MDAMKYRVYWEHFNGQTARAFVSNLDDLNALALALECTEPDGIKYRVFDGDGVVTPQSLWSDDRRFPRWGKLGE